MANEHKQGPANNRRPLDPLTIAMAGFIAGVGAHYAQQNGYSPLHVLTISSILANVEQHRRGAVYGEIAVGINAFALGFVAGYTAGFGLRQARASMGQESTPTFRPK